MFIYIVYHCETFCIIYNTCIASHEVNIVTVLYMNGKECYDTIIDLLYSLVPLCADDSVTLPYNSHCESFYNTMSNIKT